MVADRKEFIEGIKLKTSSVSAAANEIRHSGTELLYHDGTSERTTVNTDKAQTLTNKSIDSANNTITNIVNADVGAAAAIARTKIASGTNDHVIINSGAGVLSSEATLALVRGGTAQDNTNVTFPSTGTIRVQGDTVLVDGSTSGTFTLATADITTDYTVKMPDATPAVSEILQAGAGTATDLEWNSLPTSLNSTASIQTNTDYTVLDADGFRTILMSTGATPRTVTLPTAAANQNRIISIKKFDSGTGSVTVDGEGAETIDGVATLILLEENDALTIQCDGTEWHVLSLRKPIVAQIELHTPDGHGSSSTAIRSFSVIKTDVGNAFTLTQSPTLGDLVTVNEDCVVAVSYTDSRASDTTVLGISLNSSELGTDVRTILVATRVIHTSEPVVTTELLNVAATFKCSSGDVVRPHTDGSADNTATTGQFVMTQVSRNP